jgi:hypothetical protein
MYTEFLTAGRGLFITAFTILTRRIPRFQNDTWQTVLEFDKLQYFEEATIEMKSVAEMTRMFKKY